MSDLIEFLRARLDEDEAFARAAYGNRWDTDTADSPCDHWVLSEDSHLMEADAATATHAARHDPARVLREVQAKRGILDLHGGDLGEQSMFCAHCEHASPCPTLRLLASVYADHPDYRQEWTP